MFSIFRRITAVIQGKHDPAFAGSQANIDERLNQLQKERKAIAEYERAEKRRLGG